MRKLLSVKIRDKEDKKEAEKAEKVILLSFSFENCKFLLLIYKK